MVGTLDYLAPEQIRGEPVDGAPTATRSAACCTSAGRCAAVSARERGGDALGAHAGQLPLAARPSGARPAAGRRSPRTASTHKSCAELTDAAATTLGLATPPAARRRPPSRALRRRPRARTILAAGLFLLAAAIAAAILSLTTGEEGRVEPLGNGVVAIDPAKAEVVSLTESNSLPGNVAAGEGAAWFVKDGEDTISRIDPETKEVTGRSRRPARRAPSPRARERSGSGTGRPLRDHDGQRLADRSPLEQGHPHAGAPGIPATTSLASPNTGFAQIAVGAGAVWARNPDDSISRIDPDTGGLVDTIDVGRFHDRPARRASGSSPGTAPRSSGSTHARTASCRPSPSGPTRCPPSRWALGPSGRRRRTRASCGGSSRASGRSRGRSTWGVGVSYIAFGEGAVWTANYMDGTVSQIDPRTNAVDGQRSPAERRRRLRRERDRPG